jgi:hypothetical protein
LQLQWWGGASHEDEDTHVSVNKEDAKTENNRQSEKGERTTSSYYYSCHLDGRTKISTSEFRDSPHTYTLFLLTAQYSLSASPKLLSRTLATIANCCPHRTLCRVDLMEMNSMLPLFARVGLVAPARLCMGQVVGEKLK